MWDVLLLFSIFSTAVVGAPVTVTGHRGEKVHIKCSYKSGYETNSKYFCKGECKLGSKVIVVESGSSAKDERFSLTDDTTNRVFTVTITDLRTADEGQYWCAVRRRLPLPDDYSEVLLQVKHDNKATEASTISTSQATSLSSSSSSADQVNQQSTSTPVTDAHASDGHVLHVSVGLLIMVIVFLLALMLFLKLRKSKKLQRVSQSGISQHVSVGEKSSTRADVSVEDCDYHEYQEISELQNMSEHISTIYTTAESPEDWRIYYTADQPKDMTFY